MRLLHLKVSKSRWEYDSYSQDPYGVRIYTLKNGLKVYLSQDFHEPRIKTRIAVKAGATSDPDDATGLAHYVEHMMFKGTDLIGALNRDKEASIISKIKGMYEELSLAETPEDITRINSTIDNLSRAASLEAIPGELDKLYSIMGCRDTNARTGFEETVYENDIPRVELERWISLEKERFTSPVLRLFPPELEVVYEEFNQSQDDDASRAYDALLGSLFPGHPYGRAGILGKGEHLKKPSMEKIEEFLKTYYVPSNMGIFMVGDLDFDETIEIINSYWGDLEGEIVPVATSPKILEEIKEPNKTIYGPDSPFVILGYRFEGLGSEDELYLTLVDMIMSNNQAGLLDLNLAQNQRVLEAESSYEVYRDYSWFSLYGVPVKGQSLKAVSELLLKEVENLKKGKFHSWYKDAVIRCFNLDKIQEIGSSNKIESFVDSFISNVKWDEYIDRIERMNSITTQGLIEFINNKFSNNYTVIYKRRGDAKDLYQIKKPNLTPVVLNREIESKFCKSFKDIEISKNSPKFADFTRLSPIEVGRERFLYTSKGKNDLFELTLLVPYGRLHSLLAHYGGEYRDYIGTANYSNKRFQQELFKRGLDLVLSIGDEKSQITLSGFSEDFSKGIELLTEFISCPFGDKKSYKKFLRRVAVLRDNAKSSKRIILWGGMYNYLHYGPGNPFKYYLRLGELKRIGFKKTTDIIKTIFSSEIDFHYEGPLTPEELTPVIRDFSNKFEFSSNTFKLKSFPFTRSEEDFLFCHYDMVQGEVLLTSRGVKFSKNIIPLVYLFNEYFGSGMDSVVFQEVRERRGLAYSAYASYSLPKSSDGDFIFNFYIGTQGDKVVDAISCVLGLLEFFPKAENYFDAIKRGILKNIESESFKNSDLYFLFKESEKFGLDMEIREYVYKGIESIEISQLEEFFNQYIKSLNLKTLILGDKDSIDLKRLEELLGAKSHRLKLKKIFGY